MYAMLSFWLTLKPGQFMAALTRRSSSRWFSWVGQVVYCILRFSEPIMRSVAEYTA